VVFHHIDQGLQGSGKGGDLGLAIYRRACYDIVLESLPFAA
jgi:hypothetical protein